jgi:hypothetical protein
MKILLAIDGSPCSREAVAQLCAQPWKAETEVKVLSVSPASPRGMPDPIVVMSDEYLKVLADEKKRRLDMVQQIGQAGASGAARCDGRRGRAQRLAGRDDCR